MRRAECVFVKPLLPGIFKGSFDERGLFFVDHQIEQGSFEARYGDAKLIGDVVRG